jgi:hypothetical protein
MTEPAAPQNPAALLQMLPQPDDATCGPTCLHAVYRAYGDAISLDQVIDEIELLDTGGTFAVNLACHALRRGYSATIFTYNLNMFDPTWFRPGVQLAERLLAQAKAKQNPILRLATKTYLEYLELGGQIRFQGLDRRMLRTQLKHDRPLLVGLSATYLYECAREVGDIRLDYDDVRGEPTGHFVVLYGYDADTRMVQVADPYAENPGFQCHHYSVGIDRVIGAILLGVLTYDANLLRIEPPPRLRRRSTIR